MGHLRTAAISQVCGISSPLIGGEGGGGGGPFNIDMFELWVTKALNEDGELFLDFESGY